MPIVFEHITNDTQLLLWRIEEDLATILNESQRIQFNELEFSKISNDRRKKEWLITRILLNRIDPSYKIAYLENGKPYLNCPLNVSISHSQNMVGIYLSMDDKIGLDIEKIDRPIKPVASKFISDSEFRLLKNYTESELLLAVWCSKEVVFKAAGIDSIDFKKHIQIEKIDIDKDELYILGRLKKEEFDQNFRMKVMEVTDNLIVFTV